MGTKGQMATGRANSSTSRLARAHRAVQPSDHRDQGNKQLGLHRKENQKGVKGKQGSTCRLSMGSPSFLTIWMHSAASSF